MYRIMIYNKKLQKEVTMKYIIDGSFLYGHIKGVQRYARQITKELDKYMADKPYEVEIAVPEIDSEGTSAEINSYKTHYNNIKIVILAGKSVRMWEQFSFQRYVDKQKAKPVYLCNEVSLFMKNGIVTVHDHLRHIRSSLESRVTGMRYCSESLCILKPLRVLMR